MTTALDELITHYEESTASSAPESRFELAELRRSLEAAESRAASKSELIDVIIATWEQMTERLLDSEAQRDTAWSELREIREAIHSDENEATSDEVRRVVHERDELARKLEQAQHALSLADVGNFDALCDWISGAQSELYQAQLTIDNLTSPRDDFPYEGDEMEALQREATE